MDARQDIVGYLTSQAGYRPHEAEAAAEELLEAQPATLEAFLRWQQTGELPIEAVEGYTAQRLVQEYGFHPVAALLTMDWLLTDPLEAVAALAEGYDTVRPADK